MIDVPRFPPLDESRIESSLSACFEACVSRMPGALAVAGARYRLSYAECNHFANRIAHEIIERLGSASSQQRVAIVLDHDAPAIAAALGVFKSGHTCVVLDPGDPLARLQQVVEDAEPELVVTDTANCDLANRLVAGRVIEVTPRWAGEPVADLKRAIDPAAAAMILYTSGSTGRPKGVVRSHRAFLAAAFNAINVFGVNPDDRLSMFSTLGTGQGVTAPATALVRGASVHMLSLKREGLVGLAAWLESEMISVYHSSTTVWRYLARTLARDEQLRHLRVVRIGGEALRRDDLDLAARHLPPMCRSFNVYSITETGAVLVQELRGDLEMSAGSVPIGYPLPGRQVLIADDDGQVVPAGEIGEICICSRHSGDGYWGQPELTAERFIPLGDGTVMMKTGDLGRLRADGCVEYLGRRDLLLKVRGHRVDAAEIESALRAYPGVSAAAVVLQREQTDPCLVAFYVCGDAPRPRADELRQHLKHALPDASVPSMFAAIDAMPLTSSGKIDRRALTERVIGEEPRPAALSGLDARLARHFSEALGHSSFDRETDFFLVGGDSLRAAQVLSKVRDEFGVDLPFREFLLDPTIARLATGLDGDASAFEATAAVPITPRRAAPHAPLSFSQQQLWLIDRLTPGSSAYNVPRAVRLVGDLDVERLRAALDILVTRHATLRTTFGVHDLVPVQIVHAGRTADFSQVDLSAFEEPARSAEALRVLETEARRPFDLERDVLLRALVVKLAPRDHVLLLVNHHIASDARSAGVLRRELAALYGCGGEPSVDVLPPLRIDYADFAAWQREQISDAVIERQLAHWTTRLAGAPADLRLPTDRERSSGTAANAGRQAVKWSQELTLALERLARQEQVTLFMLVMAAFQTLLHRYSGADDIMVGSPVSGRSRPETEDVVGFFANTAVFRTSMAGAPTFREVIRRVRDVALDAYEHQAMPFDRLVEALRPARAAGQPPLVQVYFGLYAFSGPAFGLPGLSATPVEISTGAAKSDLTLSMAWRHDGLDGYVEYDAGVFDASTIARMMEHFEILLSRVVTDPDRKISSLPLISDAEERQAWAGWNDTARVLPASASLWTLFDTRARRNPSAPAIRWSGGEWSYGVLVERATAIARHLSGAGIRRGDRIGVLMDPSASLVAAVIGILAAGSVYVPLDPRHPSSRWLQIVRDAGVRLVLRQPGCSVDHVENVEIRDGEWRTDGETGEIDGLEGEPDDVACVMYTSGSTGMPHGVEITHRGIARLVLHTNYLSIDGSDVVALLANPAFDASTFEMFAPLLNGAAIAVLPRMAALAPATLGPQLREAGVTVLFLPTALFHRAADIAPEAFSGLRTLLVGGESMDARAAAKVLARPDHPRVVNAYGPTETTTFASWFQVDEVRADARFIPIGRPISNTEIVILDRCMRVVPIGVIGEIHIGGPGLARGYVGRSDLTSERFVPHPRRSGERLYRTGDRAFYRPDGAIVFAGRADTQVKIRGFRVEPAEVEAVLGRQAGVAQAVVVVRQHQTGESYLVAYVVPSAGAAIDVSALRAFLRDAVPVFMAPEIFVVLEALPVTSNGKVDRSSLPEPAAIVRETPAEAPVGDLEARIAAIWCEAIGIARVGRHDNFFEIGGHSLTAVHVIARIDRELGMTVSPQVIFETPALSAFASRLMQAHQTQDARRVRRRPSDVRRIPASPAQQIVWERRRKNPPDSSFMTVWAFDVEGRIDTRALGAALTRIVERHEILRTALSVSEGQLVQDVRPPYDVAVGDLDLSMRRDAVADARAWILSEVCRSFSLTAGPWLRATMLRLWPDQGHLVLSLPHSVYDAWSLDLLFDELAAFYAGAIQGVRVERPEPALQYADYTLWREAEQSHDCDTHELAYWRRQLDGLDPRPLFTSRGGFVRRGLRQATRLRTLPRLRQGRFAGVMKRIESLARGGLALRTVRRPDLLQSSRQQMDISPGVTDALRACGRGEHASLFAVMSAALQILLAQRTGDADVAFATFTAGRVRPELHDVMGPIGNTLVIRGRLHDNPSFTVLVRRVHASIVAAQAHGGLQFAELSSALARPGDLPLEHRIPIVFQLVESLRHAPDLQGARIGYRRPVSQHRSPRLALSAVTMGDGVTMTLSFDPTFYTAESAAALLRDLHAVLVDASRSPGAHVENLIARLAAVPVR